MRRTMGEKPLNSTGKNVPVLGRVNPPNAPRSGRCAGGVDGQVTLEGIKVARADGRVPPGAEGAEPVPAAVQEAVDHQAVVPAGIQGLAGDLD